LVGVQISTAVMENSTEVLKKYIYGIAI
jgi:hypothetical protein